MFKQQTTEFSPFNIFHRRRCLHWYIRVPVPHLEPGQGRNFIGSPSGRYPLNLMTGHPLYHSCSTVENTPHCSCCLGKQFGWLVLLSTYVTQAQSVCWVLRSVWWVGRSVWRVGRLVWWAERLVWWVWRSVWWLGMSECQFATSPVSTSRLT